MLEDQYFSMNTLDFDFIQSRNLEQKIIGKLNVKVLSFKEVLEQHIGDNEKINYLDIDAEGFDLNVLKSNNWEKFRPRVILINKSLNLKADFESEISQFLFTKNYKLSVKSLINAGLGFFFNNIK
jgi:hypothetical protein